MMEKIDKAVAEFNSEPPPEANPDHGASGLPDMLAEALKLAEQGFRVLPLHTPTADGACSCGRTECERVGKHPRTLRGVHDASASSAKITKWWTQWPDANIGIAGGKGFIILDIDPRNGGDTSFAAATAQHGALPHTVQAASGGSGQHYYFSAPNRQCTSRKAGSGLDVIGEGQYVVAPPSLHASGQRYSWANAPGHTQLAGAPDWVRGDAETHNAALARVDGGDGSDDGRDIRSAAKIGEQLLEGLPKSTRDKAHEDTGSAGDRSEHSFNVMLMLMEQGWTDLMIRVVAEGLPFAKKWQDRRDLRAEIARVRAKWVERGSNMAEDSPACTLRALYQTHGVVMVSGNCHIVTRRHDPALDRHVLELQNVKAFSTFYSHKRIAKLTLTGQLKFVPIAEIFLASARRFNGLTLIPPPLSCPADTFNMWQGYGVQPKPGDWSKTRYHIEHVLAGGNKEHAEYIIKWLASAVQNPASPAEVVLVFRGAQGTGKGFFGRIVMQMFGAHSIAISNPRHLTGGFNMHIADKCLLFVDEAYWPGHKGEESSLKSMVTEPLLTIEPKGMNVFQVPNCLHIIMASNKAWVVPAGPDERRYAVFDVNGSYASGMPEDERQRYFGPLFEEAANGGVEAMLHDLLNMNLDGWHPRQNVPKTQALLDQKIENLDALDRIMLDIAEQGILPCQHPHKPNVALTSLQHGEGFWNYCRQRGANELRYASDKKMSNDVARYECGSFKSGNYRGVQFPPLSEFRRLIEQSLGQRIDWDDQMEWREDRLVAAVEKGEQDPQSGGHKPGASDTSAPQAP